MGFMNWLLRLSLPIGLVTIAHYTAMLILFHFTLGYDLFADYRHITLISSSLYHLLILSLLSLILFSSLLLFCQLRFGSSRLGHNAPLVNDNVLRHFNTTWAFLITSSPPDACSLMG